MTATDSKVRIGLAGFGLSGQGLISPFLKTDEFDVRAMLSSRTNDVRKVWPGARVVKTFDALLTDDIDLIIISTPSHLHFEQAMMALEAGKAVMAEKPLALSADECATLVRKADETGNQLTVFQNRRWDSDFLTLRKTIDPLASFVILLRDVRDHRDRQENDQPREYGPELWRIADHEPDDSQRQKRWKDRDSTERQCRTIVYRQRLFRIGFSVKAVTGRFHPS